MSLRTVKDIDLKNKKVLVRVDFNVPIKNGVITTIQDQSGYPDFKIYNRTKRFVVNNNESSWSSKRRKEPGI